MGDLGDAMAKVGLSEKHAKASALRILECRRDFYPSHLGGDITITYALVEDEGGVHCFCGHGPAVWVAKRGNYVSFEEAKQRFHSSNWHEQWDHSQ